jgi:hypothetical protein
VSTDPSAKRSAAAKKAWATIRKKKELHRLNHELLAMHGEIDGAIDLQDWRLVQEHAIEVIDLAHGMIHQIESAGAA